MVVYSILIGHMESKRLSKALAAAGIASRRACEEIIFAGRVKVNGLVVKVPQTQVDWAKDQICVDGELVSEEQKKVYYMLNKPPGYLCTNIRTGNKRIVLDLFPESERLFSLWGVMELKCRLSPGFRTWGLPSRESSRSPVKT